MVYGECTPYTMDYDPAECTPCKCPVCGGFLPAELPEDSFNCKKCGAELLLIPEVDEESGKDLDCGKICAITPRQKAIYQQTTEQRRINRLVKQGAEKWKGLL